MASENRLTEDLLELLEEVPVDDSNVNTSGARGIAADAAVADLEEKRKKLAKDKTDELEETIQRFAARVAKTATNGTSLSTSSPSINKLSFVEYGRLLQVLIRHGFDTDTMSWKNSIANLSALKRDLGSVNNDIIFKAIEHAEWNRVKKYLNTYPTEKDSVGKKKMTFLYYAIEQLGEAFTKEDKESRFEFIKWLVESASCDVNAPCSDTSSTPAHAAAILPYEDVLDYLVSHGADLNVRNRAGHTPLSLLQSNSKIPAEKKKRFTEEIPQLWQYQVGEQWKPFRPNIAARLEKALSENDKEVLLDPDTFQTLIWEPSFEVIEGETTQWVRKKSLPPNSIPISWELQRPKTASGNVAAPASPQISNHSPNLEWITLSPKQSKSLTDQMTKNPQKPGTLKMNADFYGGATLTIDFQQFTWKTPSITTAYSIRWRRDSDVHRKEKKKVTFADEDIEEADSGVVEDSFGKQPIPRNTTQEEKKQEELNQKKLSEKLSEKREAAEKKKSKLKAQLEQEQQLPVAPVPVPSKPKKFFKLPNNPTLREAVLDGIYILLENHQAVPQNQHKDFGLEATESNEVKELVSAIWSIYNESHTCIKKFLNDVVLSRTKIADTLKNVKWSLNPKLPSQQYWQRYALLCQEDFELKLKEALAKFDEKVKANMKLSFHEVILGILDSYKDNMNHLRLSISALLPVADNSFFIGNFEKLLKLLEDEFYSQGVGDACDPPTQARKSALQSNFASLKKELLTSQKPLEVIPGLLHRSWIYLRAFQNGLPLFDHSRNLLSSLREAQVLSLKTPTGSGKSTLVPAMLLADGYKKVAVTQPRRLPCQLAAERVGKVFSPHVCGWAVSGAENNSNNPVVFVTDGLLKEQLLADSSVKNYNVIFLDEMHERSLNIDVCVAILAKILKSNPSLKLILSSATLDPAVLAPFRAMNVKVKEFDVPSLGILHTVQEESRKGQSAVTVAIEIFKKKQRNDQILCFLPSVNEAIEACQLFEKSTQTKAYPLYAAQSPKVQQKSLEIGSVFFSTTIAETSLTFPSLKYVIDSGRINIPKYDSERGINQLMEVFASKSNVKQRRGRLGRTQPGTYYKLFDDKDITEEHTDPQFKTADLLDTDFSLRRAEGVFSKGLASILDCLPTPPSNACLSQITERLARFGICDNAGNLTTLGKEIGKLPTVGGVRMFVSSYWGLKKYGCGQDILQLASLLMVLPNESSRVIKALAPQFKCDEGDLPSLLKFFSSFYKKTSMQYRSPISGADYCASVGMPREYGKLLDRSLKRFESVLQDIDPSLTTQASNSASGKWEPVCRALLEGYSDQLFFTMEKLQGRKASYTKIDSQKLVNGKINQVFTVISSGSLVFRPSSKPQVEVILARDIIEVPKLKGFAMLSLANEIKLSWVKSDVVVTRLLEVRPSEVTAINQLKAALENTYPRTTIQQLGADIVAIKGPVSSAIGLEQDLRTKLVKSININIGDGMTSDQQKRNLDEAMKMNYVFLPLCWRWMNSEQVKIDLNTQQKTFSAKGREEQLERVKTELGEAGFCSWLKRCSVWRNPLDGVSPQVLQKRNKDIEERIARVTDPNRSAIDLWEYSIGPLSNRQTRMEIVAWVAVCQFDCRLEGGFVRDWIVAGRSTTPNTPPNTWITPIHGGWKIDETIEPADLDLQLPVNKEFDVYRFVSVLDKYHIRVNSIIKQPFKIALLIDNNVATGPFCVELIEPHIVCTHDMIDFDVSNLYCAKNYTHELGMRIDITKPPISLCLDSIIDNIQKKKMIQLRPMDNIMQSRVNRLKKRGWTIIHSESNFFVPNRGALDGATLSQIPPSDPVYQKLNQIFGAVGKTIVRVEQISTHNLDVIYDALKLQIKKENGGNANEQLLFHGTDHTGALGIQDSGFDDRFWKQSGLYGRGAYFADDVTKSNDYTRPNAQNERVIFWVYVILGKQQTCATTCNTRTSADQGYHSVLGTANPRKEYIVYRYGQAKPFMKITYK